MRIDGTSTEQVSESQRNTPDPNGVQPKSYQYATPGRQLRLLHLAARS